MMDRRRGCLFWISKPLPLLLLMVFCSGIYGPLAAQTAPVGASSATDQLTAPRRPFSGLTDPGWLEYLKRIVGVDDDDIEIQRFADRYDIDERLTATIYQTALAEGIDPELAFRIVRTESRFKVNAKGPAGALGLMQLMPSTARSLDRSLRTPAQIMEPAVNVRLGLRYLRRMLDRYDGDVRLALLAYNRGQTTVDRHLRAGRDPENGYTSRVLGGRSGGYRGPGILKKDMD